MNLKEMIDSLKNSDSIELRNIVEKIVDIILKMNPKLSADIKWNRLTIAFNNDFHHWICGIEILKDSVSLTFHFGGLLDDENGLLIVGSSRFLRKLKFSELNEINEIVVEEFVNKAIDKLPYFICNWKEINKK